MSQDFSKGKIYKITNDFNDDVYVGSTCDTLQKRFSYHKSDSMKESNKNWLLYKLTNEIGFERFRIDLIEDYPCEDKQALRLREGYWIREIGTLNKLIAGRTKQEANKEYCERNKDKKAIYDKDYREKNKDKKLENDKKYYETNKDYLKENITCECGCLISRRLLPRHRKSQKHLNCLTSNTQ